MSRARGLDLQNALAAWLRVHGWPHAESAGSGRNGTDVTGTPGIVWENKTAREFSPLAFVRQAKVSAQIAGGHRLVPVVVYWPVGVGDTRADFTLAIVPLGRLAALLREAGYGDE